MSRIRNGLNGLFPNPCHPRNPRSDFQPLRANRIARCGDATYSSLPMKRITSLLIATSVFAGLNILAAEADRLVYPAAPKSSQADNYFSTKVPDPYRDLENADAPATRKWIEAENKLTFDYLAAIPERKAINDKLTAVWNYEKYSVPFHEGGRYFFTKNTGLQNQSVLYSGPVLPGEAKPLLDPNTLAKDGTVALSGMDVTDDGKLLAYGLAVAGSDWQEWKVRDIASGQDLPDDVQWVKFSNASWKKDGSGFFYSRYDAPASADQLKQTNYFHKLYFHKLGTAQKADQLVYERKDHKDWNFSGAVTEDGRILIINVSQGTDPKNRIFYKNLELPNAPVVELLNKQDASYEFIGYEGSSRSTRSSPNVSRPSCRKRPISWKVSISSAIGLSRATSRTRTRPSVSSSFPENPRARFHCRAWGQRAASPENAKTPKRFTPT